MQFYRRMQDCIMYQNTKQKGTIIDHHTFTEIYFLTQRIIQRNGSKEGSYYNRYGTDVPV